MTEGFPKIIQSDNGGEFKNWLLHSIASSNGIEIKHSEPYNSGTQGLVEKYNFIVPEIYDTYPPAKHRIKKAH